MSDESASPAERIAGDLALAIHQGLIRGGERLPSQTQLMAAYKVAMGTAAAALTKLSAAGLSRGESGRGTFAVHLDGARPLPVLEVMAAASLCRQVAATSFPLGAAVTLGVGGDREGNTEDAREKTAPPQQVDVSALAALDRHVLRWMSEAFLAAARRLVGSGRGEADEHLIAAARSILAEGGRRPEGQQPIAVHGPRPEGEDVALRIWPERGLPAGPDGPPF
jgi:DNA-binding transcriptional MocR family regulator